VTSVRTPIRWKVIIASDGPWSGEMYHSRAGTDRHRFGSVVEFCGAVLKTTQWSLPTSGETAGGDPAGSTAGGRGGGVRRPATKIVVAADHPWRGDVYATTSTGSGPQTFTGFEEFIRAVVDVAGWRVRER
jgi:hypothetical protein